MKIRHVLLASVLNTSMVTANAQDAHTQHHQPAQDSRVILELSPDERAMILEEMRLEVPLAGIDLASGAHLPQAGGTAGGVDGWVRVDQAEVGLG